MPFEPPVTDAQEHALAKLEAGLALVEGWVDHVSSRAVAPHLPNAARLAEMMARRRASGFTVIEVTMAAFVMVVGLASSLNVLSAGLRALDDARNITLASQILQSELERLRLLPWSSSTGGP